MEYQISKKNLWNVDSLRFSPWKSAVEKTTHRFHSWILLTENYLWIRKKFIWSINHWYIKDITLPTLPANNSAIFGVFIFHLCDIFGQTVHSVQKVRFVKAPKTAFDVFTSKYKKNQIDDINTNKYIPLKPLRNAMKC